MPRDFDTLTAEAAAYVTLPGGHPQGYADCFDAFVAETYAAIRGRAGRRRAADARRRAARGCGSPRRCSSRRASATWVEVAA